jgi:hypothetical protein
VAEPDAEGRAVVVPEAGDSTAPDALATWVAAGVGVGRGVGAGEHAAEIRATRTMAATRIRTIDRCYPGSPEGVRVARCAATLRTDGAV